ncbi:outer membrane protein assembly factor BamC [Halomonas caseinilytica]|uniref:outer membrane protein assembly factor BamC n=1 Tax=Halomonas caseinilytica TaxID=438744 RepID=UPI0008492A2C|nr:outer membrane protein assembly factor BamC [Halomonas caseinilytica]
MNSALKWMPLLAALALAGCAREGYYDNRSVDYAKAKESAPLELPDTRNTRRYRDAMPVPDVPGAFASQGDAFQAPPPRALNAGSGVAPGEVTRREAGEQSWLVVGAALGTVWSEIGDFATARGLEVLSRDDRRGVMETDQGRISVSPGLHQGVSEVRCEQAGAAVEGCLRALERRFEQRSNLASATASGLSVQGRMAQTSQPPRLEQAEDGWQLVLPYDLDRAWAELSAQLKADFSLEDRRQLLEQDISTHTFLVDYLPLSERSRGVWESLTSLKFSEQASRLRLTLSRQGANQTLVRASAADDEALAANDARELLERVGGLLR